MEALERENKSVRLCFYYQMFVGVVALRHIVMILPVLMISPIIPLSLCVDAIKIRIMFTAIGNWALQPRGICFD